MATMLRRDPVHPADRPGRPRVSSTSMARGEGTVRVGCSGWVYRDWRGAVYPEQLPQREWFAAYAQWFDTVEINNTFYRLPPVSTVERWARQAPAGFVYAVK